MRSTLVSLFSSQNTNSSVVLSRYPLPSSLRTGRSSSATAGRNAEGRITVRHRGGGHKRAHRFVDWSRSTSTNFSFAVGFVYDPRRTARLVQVLHRPRTQSEAPFYSLFPATQGRIPLQSVKVHTSLSADAPSGVSSTLGSTLRLQPGDQAPLWAFEPGDLLHSVQAFPGQTPLYARAAGTYCQVRSVERGAGFKPLSPYNPTSPTSRGFVILRLPSGALRRFPLTARATVGPLAVEDPLTQSGPLTLRNARSPLGKAGRSRWLGRRPTVRGTARNPVDHPHGGNSRGRPSVTFKGWPTKGGYPTRSGPDTNRFIVSSRQTGPSGRRPSSSTNLCLVLLENLFSFLLTFPLRFLLHKKVSVSNVPPLFCLRGLVVVFMSLTVAVYFLLLLPLKELDIALVSLPQLVSAQYHLQRNLHKLKVKRRLLKRLVNFYFFFIMGQKTPSVALRLGLHRKWSTSWFPVEFTSSGSSPALSSASLAKASAFATSPFLRLSPHTVPRGGQSRSGREERLFSFFCRRPFIFSSPARPSFGAASSTFPHTLPSFLTLASVGSPSDSQVSSFSVRPTSRRRPSALSSAPLSSPHRFYPIDLHIRVGSGGQLFIFFVYVKLLGRSKTALPYSSLKLI